MLKQPLEGRSLLRRARQSTIMEIARAQSAETGVPALRIVKALSMHPSTHGPFFTYSSPGEVASSLEWRNAVRSFMADITTSTNVRKSMEDSTRLILDRSIKLDDTALNRVYRRRAGSSPDTLYEGDRLITDWEELYRVSPSSISSVQVTNTPIGDGKHVEVLTKHPAPGIVVKDYRDHADVTVASTNKVYSPAPDGSTVPGLVFSIDTVFTDEVTVNSVRIGTLQPNVKVLGLATLSDAEKDEWSPITIGSFATTLGGLHSTLTFESQSLRGLRVWIHVPTAQPMAGAYTPALFSNQVMGARLLDGALSLPTPTLSGVLYRATISSIEIIRGRPPRPAPVLIDPYLAVRTPQYLTYDVTGIPRGWYSSLAFITKTHAVLIPFQPLTYGYNNVPILKYAYLVTNTKVKEGVGPKTVVDIPLPAPVSSNAEDPYLQLFGDPDAILERIARDGVEYPNDRTLIRVHRKDGSPLVRGDIVLVHYQPDLAPGPWKVWNDSFSDTITTYAARTNGDDDQPAVDTSLERVFLKDGDCTLKDKAVTQIVTTNEHGTVITLDYPPIIDWANKARHLEGIAGVSDPYEITVSWVVSGSTIYATDTTNWNDPVSFPVGIETAYFIYRPGGVIYLGNVPTDVPITISYYKYEWDKPHGELLVVPPNHLDQVGTITINRFKLE